MKVPHLPKAGYPFNSWHRSLDLDAWMEVEIENWEWDPRGMSHVVLDGRLRPLMVAVLT